MTLVGYNDRDEMLGRLSWVYETAHPTKHICLSLPSTRAAPAALAERRSDLAPMGAEMSEADLATFANRGEQPPVAVRVAHDSLKPGSISSPTGVFVHRSNPLRRISIARLRAIFTGGPDAPETWALAGSTDRWQARPLHPVSVAATTAIGQHLLGHVFHAGVFRPEVAGFHESREVAKAVGDDEDALGLFNLSHRNQQVRALEIIDDDGRIFRPSRKAMLSGAYPLDRFLLVYTRRIPAGPIEPGRFFAATLTRERGGNRASQFSLVPPKALIGCRNGGVDPFLSPSGDMRIPILE